MLEILQTTVVFLVTISIVVTIHEYGHYLVARRCGVYVLRFSIGFGKPLFTWRGAKQAYVDPETGKRMKHPDAQLRGAEFAIAPIPLGGYVKMLDERVEEVPEEAKHMAFNNKSPLQRIAVAFAGPAANFLLAIAVYWLLFTVGVSGVAPLIGGVQEGSKAARAGLKSGQEIVAVDGVPTRTWSEVSMQLVDHLGESGPIVFTVVQGDSSPADYEVRVQDWMSVGEATSPLHDLGLSRVRAHVPATIGMLTSDGRAKAAGMQVGDEVRGVNGQPVGGWEALVDVVKASPETLIALEVIRDGRTVYLDVTPKAVERGGATIGLIGAAPEPVETPPELQRKVAHPFYLAWVPALARTWEITTFTLDALRKMLVGAISTQNLSGPITIAQIANATAENGFESFIGFVALLSISLGVINLLPVPVLDGGHILYALIELGRGRPLSEKAQMLGVRVGIALVACLMLLAFYNDFARLWGA